VRGPGRDKFFYHLEVLETKALLPSTFQKAMKDLVAKDPDADYPFMSLEIEAAGTVAKEGEGYVFTARGSKQKYALKPSEGLKKLLAAGKIQLTVTGKVLEPAAKDGQKPPPLIEVAEASETPAR